MKIFAQMSKKQYFCTVFFMVLDLRLSKDWVVEMTILLFFCLFRIIFVPLQRELKMHWHD